MAGNNDRDRVYQLITDDAMEMVLVQTDTLQELAEETGIKKNTLFCAMSRGHRVKYRETKVRVLRVELDDEDDDEEGLENGE